MRKFFFALFSTIILLGCEQNAENPDALKPEIEAFGEKIETGLANGKVGVLDLHFDKNAFVERVVDDPYWDEQLTLIKEKNYKADYTNRLLQELSLAQLFLSGVDGRKYFTYDLAKVYRIENKWHAVFRMYANDALNYHDYLLRVDSNKVWIEDVYIMAVGRQLSKIMQESYVSGIPSAFSDKRKRDNVLLMRSKMLLDREQYQAALTTFDSISRDYRNQKSLRLYELQISANIPNEAYVRALEAYEKDFPDDAGTLLLQVDKNFLYGNYPEVLKTLAKLETYYGQDPVIDYMKANALNALDKCEEASVFYEKTLSEKPEWQEPFFNWVSCRLNNRDYQEAVDLLVTYEKTFDLTPTYVQYIFSDYPNFFLSKPYKDWKTKQS